MVCWCSRTFFLFFLPEVINSTPSTRDTSTRDTSTRPHKHVRTPRLTWLSFPYRLKEVHPLSWSLIRFRARIYRYSEALCYREELHNVERGQIYGSQALKRNGDSEIDYCRCICSLRFNQNTEENGVVSYLLPISGRYGDTTIFSGVRVHLKKLPLTTPSTLKNGFSNSNEILGNVETMKKSAGLAAQLKISIRAKHAPANPFATRKLP